MSPAAAEPAEGGEPQAQSIRVAGEPLEALPDDLYIPPDAMRVFLEAFEGPLDLLLYLIRRQNLDILDIPVFTITQQYMAYIELMEDMAIELAGEYLLMAAMLAEIKSRMLLPSPAADEADEGEDPRAELVRRLQEYERFKAAAEHLDAWPRAGRDLVPVQHPPARLDIVRPEPEADLRALLAALRDVFSRAELFSEHRIEREPLSVREHMSRILERLGGGAATAFLTLVDTGEGRLGVVVSFLAILELAREALIVIEQADPRAPVALRLAAASGDN
ncbi:segregation and condensation protein A [Salinisphaera orenii]|uniref:Segregation and condensation protein A n=1 Tax=Salinisphaera orenii YIM 95161 TaxID=1051139 RepID=A0A423Q1M2_9GAMM|nr:ScpA family protein [Salinisphaera halophila]ROO32422.1 chromosome segregation protein ScpA [Salinisphaera halophila YIM 95161]